jgi:hypothetical protein
MAVLIGLCVIDLSSTLFAVRYICSTLVVNTAMTIVMTVIATMVSMSVKPASSDFFLTI